MTAIIECQGFQECFEYHGNVAVERTRLNEGIVERDWLYFDSTEEAEAFFNEQCACV